MDNKILNGTYFGCNKKTDIAQFIYQHFILFRHCPFTIRFCPYDLEEQLAINHTQAVLQGKKRTSLYVYFKMSLLHTYLFLCLYIIIWQFTTRAVKCQTTQDIHKLEYPAARAGRSGSIPIITKTKRTTCCK